MTSLELEVLKARSNKYVLTKITTNLENIQDALGLVLRLLREDEIKNVLLTLQNGSQIEIALGKK